jgi:hypothetical protein
MKKVYSFLVIMFALTGMILFVAGRPGDGATRSSPTSQPGEKKPTFTGEFEFHEVLTFVVPFGVQKLDLRANIPFEISWNNGLGAWAIKGSAKDAKGTSIATAPNGATCQAPLKGKIDIYGGVSGEKLKACLFDININQKWENYVWICRIPKVPPFQQEVVGFTLKDEFKYLTEAGPHSKQVEDGVMKGIIFLQLKKFSGTLIDGCGVIY